MNAGETYNGFELISVTRVEELSANVHLFRHKKTGAELLWTGRSDTNKTFSITFKTIPEDDTGVFHILEHSVLCGSDKYPVKEPFVELLKGSLNTFLNAMTFPDKTMYPVASRNDADFRNLMRVYLDAVFCPAIYKNENIFLQEGWHYETDESGKPRYVGVVFGEMTGAFSSVDRIIETGILRHLFPDNCYGYVSGGHPDHIPELTYEKFIESHKRFYHPSNSRIFLDGDMDVEDVLGEIDRDYLSKYDHRAPDAEIREQKILPYSESTVKYAVTPDGKDSPRAHFAMGRIIGGWRDIEKMTAVSILRNYLIGSNSAPLTRAVLEGGLGQDVRFVLDDGMAQNFVTLQIRNTTEDKLPGLRSAVKKIIEDLLKDGIDHKEIEASLNRLEFLSRERNEPYGVQLAILADQSWLYGGDPVMYFENEKIFASLRDKLNGSYFEDLLSEIFLPDEGLAVLHVLPSETLEAETAAKQRERLNSEFDKLGEEERKAIAEKTKALELWHKTPDSAEALATIPRLDLSDIPTEPLLTKVNEGSVAGVPLLRPEIETNGTVYLDLYFALPDVSLEMMSAASLITLILSQLPTKDHTAKELQRLIKSDLGKMSFGINVYSRPGESDRCVPYFTASFSALESKLDSALSLLGEVLTSTELDHPDKIFEIVKQSYTRHQQRIVTAGNSYGVTHALSGQSAEFAALERIGGYSYFDWLRGLTSDFDSAFPTIKATFEEILSRLTRASLTVGVIGNAPDEKLAGLCRLFPEGEKKDCRMTVRELKPSNDAIIIPAGIGYAVKAVDIYRVCDKTGGRMALMSNLLSLDYLWNEVRVKGGAYDAELKLTANGGLFAYSYRDPNPARSLGIYAGASQYLRKCCEEKKDLDQLIIGAVSDSEPLRSAHGSATVAVTRKLRGITDEKLRADRRELLGATHDDLLECCRILDEADKYGSICVVAGETLVDACELEFDNKFRA